MLKHGRLLKQRVRTRHGATRALAAASALVAGCGSPPAPTPPKAVELEPAAGAEETSETDSSPRPREPSSFDAHVSTFIAAASEHRGNALDDWVDSEHGLLLATNPGAFVVVSAHPSFTAARDAVPHRRILHEPLDCDPTRRDNVPTYDCGTERYDTAERCVYGEASSKRLTTYARGMKLGELPGADEAIQSAERSEPRATHFFFDARQDLVFYLGRRGDRWSLVWVDAVTPCDA